MTLIASFEFNNTPILVGDLLLTAEGRFASQSTPLVDAPNSIIGVSSKRQVAGLSQKLALLHDHVCMAWAGSHVHAVAFAEYIRSFVVGKQEINYNELRTFVMAYPRADLVAHIDFIVYSWHGAGWGYFSNLTPFDLESVENIRVSGTGTEHFVNTISVVSQSPVSGNLDGYNELAMRALSYAGIASAQQFFAGIGLAEAWGGGFEVVVFKDGRLEKIGPICWLYWTCIQLNEATYSLVLHPSFMYQFYRGDSAFYWIDEDASGTNKLHAVGPPFRTAEPSFDHPGTIETNTLVSLVRRRLANGEIWDGCFIDRKATDETPSMRITKAIGQVNATVNPAFVNRLLGSMSLPPGATFLIDLWGSRIVHRPPNDESVTAPLA